MSKRRALLIGVSEYESNAVPDLPIVRRDLELLHFAFENSGFTVNSIGTDGIAQTGRSKILQALRRECKEAQGIDTLILYFSGHGIHYRGKDFLVPSDAAFDDADVIEDYLVSTDISDVVDQSGAKTVVFFIDACREGVKLGIKDAELISWSRGERRQSAQRNHVMVFACGAGQVSQYVVGETGFSLFSLALSEILAPPSEAITLGAILHRTQARLDALVTEHKKQPQKIYYAYESSVEDDLLAQIVCDGTITSDFKEDTVNIWSEAVLQSPLWRDDEEDLCVSSFKKRSTEIVDACWQQWQSAKVSFPQDTWRDEELPIRVLESLELLVFRSNPQIELNDAETALAIIVPFVREAVLASGMLQAAKVDALSLEGGNTEHELRQSLDENYQTLSRFARKAKRLQEQGRSEDRDAVITWMIYQYMLKALETWLPESMGGYVVNNFIQSLDDNKSCDSRLVRETVSRHRLLELAQCMHADFERIDRDDRPGALQVEVNVGSYRYEQNIREKMLAYVLKLAGMLAVDVRMLSDVLVDHIGLADPLTPEQIRTTIAQIRWVPYGQGRVLSVACNHPAVDLALREQTEQAGFVLSHMLRQVELSQSKMDALVGLPTSLLPDKIIAAKRDDEPVYQTPHVNFQLAHDEVRELFMGEQLYGDPMLAIRELYQNALDACRYRRARLQYLKQVGQCKGENRTWEGRIVFRQMTGDDGRVYIECEDNGIGMAMQHLESCFARAGRRFADLPEFIEEQAEWLKCNPPIRLYPNSQFGVGVLSYFMLADEIEIETCRLTREGHPGERLQVRIPGSSGLFRVRRLGPGNDTGTRVRLYLNRTRHKGQLISCIETLRRLLWVAEFVTEAHHFGRQEIWEPGKLKHPEYPDEFCLNVAETDIWWVPEIYYWQKSGCILSDGLWTREAKPGFVINLHSGALPRLTVDRKEIIEYDQFRITNMLIQHSESVLNWKGLDLELLWRLSRESPSLAEYIVDGLQNKDANLPIKAWGIDNFTVSVVKTGCFGPDYYILQSRYGISIPNLIKYSLPYWLLPLRLLVWQDLGLFNFFEPCLDSIPPSMRPEHWPELQPADGVILKETLPPDRYLTPSIDGYVPPAHIIHAAFRLNEPLIKTVKRFEKFVPLGLEMPKMDISLLHEIDITDEDVIAVSSIIDEDLPYSTKKNEQWKYPWPKGEVSVGQIVITAVRLNETVTNSVKRFQKFAPVGLRVIATSVDALRQIDVTSEDLIALSTGLTGETAYYRNKISPVHIASTAQRLNESVTDTIKRFRKFIPLGLKLPDLNTGALFDYGFEQDDVVAKRIIERELWNSDENVTVEQLVNIAGQLNEPIVDTIVRLERYAPLGLKLLEVDRSQVRNITVDREDMIIFSERDRSYYNCWESSWADNTVTSPHLVKAAVNLNESVEDVVFRLRKFIPLGLKLPQFNIDSLNELVKSENDLIVMTKTLTKELASPREILHGNVHPVRILLASLHLKEPLTETFARFQRFAPVLGLNLPKGDPSTWQFTRTDSVS